MSMKKTLYHHFFTQPNFYDKPRLLRFRLSLLNARVDRLLIPVTLAEQFHPVKSALCFFPVIVISTYRMINTVGYEPKLD